MKPKVIIGHPISERRLQSLGKEYEIETIKDRNNKRDQVYDLISDHVALFAISHIVDRRLMKKASNLKIIANYGVGYDNIDVAAAQSFDIAVTNTPYSTSTPTAVHTLGLIVSLLRKIVVNDHRIRQGKAQDWSDPNLLGTSPADKTLGIIGMGRIGQEVAKRAKAFDMKVIYYKRNRLSETTENELGASFRTMEALLSECDILTIHTPLNKDTHHLIGREQIDKMKMGSFIINTARGEVIDHKALIQTLKSGQLGGAGLDVFPDEPKVPEEYLSMENVVLTPHTGTGTREARAAMFDEGWSNIVNFLRGDGPISRVV